MYSEFGFEPRFTARSARARTAGIRQLSGHSGRAFNVLFHPLLPELITSGSDDHTVRVWTHHAVALGLRAVPSGCRSAKSTGVPACGTPFRAQNDSVSAY